MYLSISTQEMTIWGYIFHQKITRNKIQQRKENPQDCFEPKYFMMKRRLLVSICRLEYHNCNELIQKLAGIEIGIKQRGKDDS